MSETVLTLLGDLVVARDGQPVELPTLKARLLLAVLALPPGQRWTRRQLIDMFWSTRGPDQARGSLRNALSALRRALGAEALAVDGEWVALAEGAMDIDALDFEALLAEGTGEAMTQAVALYNGPLMAGIELDEPQFEDWLARERWRHAEMARQALAGLLRVQEQHGDEPALQETGLRLLAEDPLAEEAHRALMRLYAAQGQRARALQQYESLRSALAGELGITPEPATEELAASLRDGAGVAVAPAASPLAAAPVAAPVASQQPSIAVLPFWNLAGDPDIDHFCTGIAGDIIASLCRFRWLRVTSANSTLGTDVTQTDALSQGRALGVGYVVEGSLRKGTDRIRVAATLVEVASGAHLWADTFDRELADVLILQDEMAAEVGAAIAPEIAATETQRAQRQPTAILGAWELHSRARWHMYRFTAEDNAEARRLFREAMAADPSFAAPHTLLAYNCYLAVIEGYAEDDAAALTEARGAAGLAIQLDEKNAVAHSIMAQLYLMEGEHQLGIDEAEMAVRLNPSSARAHYGLGFACAFGGQPADAVQAIERAMALSPHDPNMWSMQAILGLAHLVLEQYDDAVHWCRAATRQPINPFWPFATLASALGHLDREDEARQSLQKLLEMRPDFTLGFAAEKRPFKLAADRERYLEGLRRAGLES